MNKKFDGMVASIQKDGLAVVVNKGSSSGVKVGMHYLIYNKGEEIMDPETNVSLGTLEIVCGKGIVTHVQENMATIKSSEKDTSVSKVIRPKFHHINKIPIFIDNINIFFKGLARQG